MNLLFVDPNETEKMGADISECGMYRYHLWRLWDTDKPIMVWIMLNPSTADANEDDATIRRCVAFAKREGFGGISVRNVFAFRATDPDELRKHYARGINIMGDRNPEILTGCRNVGLMTRLVVGWGSLPSWMRKTNAYMNATNAARMNDAYCFGVTKDNSPRHPLYLRGDSECIKWPHPV